MIAETVLGRGDRAFEVYKKIAPAYLEEISDIHRTEPYVYSQMVAGKDAVRHGEAKNSWLTGTAAWNYFAITQWILGVKPEYDGLSVNPCIPPEWNGFDIKRVYRGDTYNIEVKNPEHVCMGVKEIKVDGKVINEKTLPVFGDGSEHKIEIKMGK